MSEGTIPVSGSTNARVEVAPSARAGWVVALWIAFILSLGLVSTLLAAPAAILYVATALALFMLPGFVLIPAFIGSDTGSRPVRAIFGAVIGLALSSYIAIVIGFLRGWSPVPIGLAILALCVVCAIITRALKDRAKLPFRAWTSFDSAVLAVVGITVVLFSASPMLHVGKLTSRGYAYTWLYGIDLFTRSDFAVAMTTKLPPDLFSMTGIPLKMYLVGYAAPAFAFAASGKSADIHSITLLVALCFGFLMLACLYILLRTLFPERKAHLPAMFLVLFAYSYYWVYDAVKSVLMQPGQRMQFYDSVSHLFQRTMLVEPQAALATSLLVIILSLIALMRYRLANLAVAVLIGLSLGLAFGMDGMQAVVMIGWFGLFYLGRLLFAKGTQRDQYLPFAIAVATCGIICISFLWLGMYERSSSHLITFELSGWLLKNGIVFFPLEFGPLIIFGGWGIVSWWRGRREDFGWPLLVLAILAMLEALLLKTTTVPRTRMLDRFLPLVLASFTAYLCRDWRFAKGRFARFSAIAAVALAIPTFFTDIHYTSDVNDLYDTRYVRVADQQACDWIRQNLPETAVVQGYYNYFTDPDRGLYLSLIASFAQRPQVLGWYSGAATLVADGWRLAGERRSDIEKTLASNQLPSLVAFTRKYSIDYLYVGPSEQNKYPLLLSLIKTAPDQFKEVYSKDGVSIFRYLRNDATAQLVTHTGS